MDTSLRERATLIRRGWMILEAGITTAAFVGAVWIYHIIVGSGGADPLRAYAPLLLVIVPLWSGSLAWLHMYHTQRLTTFKGQSIGLLKVHGLGGAVAAIAVAVGWLGWADRTFVAIFLVISLALLSVERIAVLTLLHVVRRRGRNARRALIIGGGQRAAAFVRAVAAHDEWGLRIIGLLQTDQDQDDEADVDATGVPVLGHIDGLHDVLERSVVDEVIFCVHPHSLKKIQEAFEEAELRGLIVRLVADFMDLRIARADVGHADGLPILTFTSRPHRVLLLTAKRVVDVSVASLLLVLLLPMMTVIGILIRLGSPGCTLFRQERLGRNGRPFVMYKFRSMCEGAEAATPALSPHSDVGGPVFKLRADPRVTAVGRWLRAWSLDELPQLWNVVRGDMSLVGPRPPLAAEVSQYEPWQRRRLSMKPGITGPWQVAGRSQVGFDEWMNLDLAYIDNWSLKTDFLILARTIPAVLSGRGAW